MKNIQSLHSHTTNSDGKLTPLELLNTAKKYNFNTIAITDHDSVLKNKQVNEIKDIKDIRWISGIEISSGWPLDLGGGSSSSFHIVGLFVDYNNSELKDYCKKAQEARIERMRRMTKNLNNISLKITENDCIKESGGETVGRPHIVKALMKYEENIKRMHEIKEDLRKASIRDNNLKEKYNQILESPIDRWPYLLFLTEDSFINDVYVDYLFYSDFDNTVKLIRNAGGVALIAHYFSCMKKITPEYLEKIIKEKRIDGLETIYGLFAYGTSEEEYIKETEKITKDIVNKYKCIEGGGADIHTENELIMLNENNEYSEKTENLLENMLNNFKINTKYSNLK
jgi:predicted metal-dependent phosphoesterase TrpH